MLVVTMSALSKHLSSLCWYAGTLCGSEAAQMMLAKLARSAQPKQHLSDRAADVAAYSARLHALRAALHAAVRSALVQGPFSEAAGHSERLFKRLLTAWEDIKSQEEQKAAEEAEMFKTKTRKIASEEVREGLQQRKLGCAGSPMTLFLVQAGVVKDLHLNCIMDQR